MNASFCSADYFSCIRLTTKCFVAGSWGVAFVRNRRNKVGNVRVTQHFGAFASRILEWKRNSTLWCIVEVHITFSNIEILCVAQDILSWRIYIAGDNKMYSGLRVNFAIFLYFELLDRCS